MKLIEIENFLKNCIFAEKIYIIYMTKSRIYYCNPFLTTDKLEFLQQNKCALHSFYGLFHFSNDIEVIIHKQREYPKSLIGRIMPSFTTSPPFLPASGPISII